MFPGLKGLWKISSLSSICTRADVQSPCTPGPVALFILFLVICLCVYLSRRSRPDFCNSGSRRRAALLSGVAARRRESRRLQVIGGAE